MRSYDLDGKPLWELGGMSIIGIPTPFAGHGLLYVASGYVLDQAEAVSPSAGRRGRHSAEPRETANKYIAWCQK